MEEDEEILAECSDDEEFDKLGITVKTVWSPKFEEIEALYKNVKEKKVLELDWKSPARRDPNAPLQEISTELENTQLSNSSKNCETDDFAFEDESAAPSRPSPKTTKTGSIFKSKNAKRTTTTTLAGILSNMQRHRDIEKSTNK